MQLIVNYVHGGLAVCGKGAISWAILAKGCPNSDQRSPFDAIACSQTAHRLLAAPQLTSSSCIWKWSCVTPPSFVLDIETSL